VILSVPGVGPGADRPDLRYFKNPKVMTLIMNVHPEDSDRTTAAVMEGTYACDGAPDREAYFFRRATLGINRAFEFLETLPEWDHENIGLWGSSQGGAYALILAGLNPGKIKFVAANVPALCEHTAHLVGRSSGWPLLLANTPAGTEAMAPYFDTVNFARRIADPVVIGVGWIDAACGPSSVYAAYNQITSDKEIFDGVTMGHDFDPRFVAYMVPAMYKALGVE
jgi:cephalosporin-C deacetylase-like acetyl esterase